MNKLQEIIHILGYLQSDSRLTTEEQRAISLAWGYLYYLDVVEKKMSEQEKGKHNLPQ